MTAQAAVQRDAASVAKELHSLVGQRTTIENQQCKFSDRLLAIDAEVQRLKQRHFDGDAQAAPAIDKLETEKRDLLRRVEGAKVYIDQFDEKIIPLRHELRGLNEIAAAKDAAQDARRRFEAFEAKLNDLVGARIATYQAACRALFEEVEFLNSEIDLLSLNEGEKIPRLHALERAHKRLEAVFVEIVNDKWKSVAVAFGLGRLTELVVKLPPESENGFR